MEFLRSDVWVIGSGAAGLMAAISAREAGARVRVVSKLPAIGGSASGLSGGGFVGAWGGLTKEEHRDRTIAVGRGLNDPVLLNVLVEETPKRFRDMLDWGLPIVNSSRPGSLVTEGQGPGRGRKVVERFAAKAASMGVEFIDNLLVRSLSVEGGIPVFAAWSADRGEWVALVGAAAVLATGGAASIYRYFDTPEGITGDSYALALDAGAVVQDMEFFQFYPLSLNMEGLPPSTVPAPVADLGNLVNGKGEDILAKHDIPRELAAIRQRDRLSQALFVEIEREGQEVFVDMVGVTKETWSADPAAGASYTYFGETCGAWERPLRVAPTAHFGIGGVSIDADGTTTLAGLFAAGEATSGLHGANRMGENSLSETIVFGHRAGRAAALGVAGNGVLSDAQALARAKATVPEPAPGTPVASAAELLSRLRRAMWRYGGILRDAKGTATGLGEVAEVREDARKTGGGFRRERASRPARGSARGPCRLADPRRRRPSRGKPRRALSRGLSRDRRGELARPPQGGLEGRRSGMVVRAAIAPRRRARRAGAEHRHRLIARDPPPPLTTRGDRVAV